MQECMADFRFEGVYSLMGA